MDKDTALDKLRKYCAYQDRCHLEVRRKLLDYGIYGDWQEEIIADLISDNYLNEERYARSIARGRFRMKQWGRKKIRIFLEERRVSDYCIRQALSEIDSDDYILTLDRLIENRIIAEKQKERSGLVMKDAVIQYLIRRGYEPELVYRQVREREVSSDNPFGK